MNSVMNEIVQIEKELGFAEDEIIEIDEMMLRISELLPPEKRGSYKDIKIKDYLLTEDC